MAGERFVVRNSGAIAVVEGVGDHGCEYMTGGRVAILGPTGKNFAAGMSGGIAYVLDEHNDLYTRLNKSLISIEELTNKYDVQELKEMITEHAKTTGSAKESISWNTSPSICRSLRRLSRMIISVCLMPSFRWRRRA